MPHELRFEVGATIHLTADPERVFPVRRRNRRENSMSGAGPTQGANGAPPGGSAAATAASVGVVTRGAGPTQGANGAAASGGDVACAAFAFRPPSTRADARCAPWLRPARLDVHGGRAAATVASAGEL